MDFLLQYAKVQTNLFVDFTYSSINRGNRESISQVVLLSKKVYNYYMIKQIRAFIRC
jgi:uncharacterized protein with PhoU and TrkA domain